MIIPRNLHPTEHSLYEKVCFAGPNARVRFGQINEIQGQGSNKKYKILSWTNDEFFNTWVTSSSILEDRRIKQNKVLNERRKGLLSTALKLLT